MNAAVAKSSSEHTTILVGNLAKHAGEEDIRSLFGVKRYSRIGNPGGRGNAISSVSHHPQLSVVFATE